MVKSSISYHFISFHWSSSCLGLRLLHNKALMHFQSSKEWVRVMVITKKSHSTSTLCMNLTLLAWSTSLAFFTHAWNTLNFAYALHMICIWRRVCRLSRKLPLDRSEEKSPILLLVQIYYKMNWRTNTMEKNLHGNFREIKLWLGWQRKCHCRHCRHCAMVPFSPWLSLENRNKAVKSE